MDEQKVRDIQSRLNSFGFNLAVDGDLGPITLEALHEFLCGSEEQITGDHLAWGAATSAEFRARIWDIVDGFGWRPEHANWLMACIAFESGRSFSPSIRNAAGSGATGLIQFMPFTARDLGTSTDELASMTAVEQLDYVEAYFRPYADRIESLSDMYLAILMPRYVGSPENTVLFDGGIAYRQNKGLDANRDGDITKGEAAAKVKSMLAEGLRTGNVWRRPA